MQHIPHSWPLPTCSISPLSSTMSMKLAFLALFSFISYPFHYLLSISLYLHCLHTKYNHYFHYMLSSSSSSSASGGMSIGSWPSSSSSPKSSESMSRETSSWRAVSNSRVSSVLHLNPCKNPPLPHLHCPCPHLNHLWACWSHFCHSGPQNCCCKGHFAWQKNQLWWEVLLHAVLWVVTQWSQPLRESSITELVSL
jgi:hypothetical protein